MNNRFSECCHVRLEPVYKSTLFGRELEGWECPRCGRYYPPVKGYVFVKP